MGSESKVEFCKSLASTEVWNYHAADREEECIAHLFQSSMLETGILGCFAEYTRARSDSGVGGRWFKDLLGKVFDWNDIANAHQLMESNTVIGRIFFFGKSLEVQILHVEINCILNIQKFAKKCWRHGTHAMRSDTMSK